MLAGHRVHERLVHDQGAAGPRQPGDLLGGVQDGGGVGRVADDDEVGLVGDRVRGQPEAVPLGEQQPFDRVPGVAQRRLRLGELRVHDERPPGPYGAGDQYERLRRARRQQHPFRREAVPGRHRPACRAAVRVRGEPVQRGRDACLEPGRRRPGAHVDREVGQSGVRAAHFGVPVVAQVRFVRVRAGYAAGGGGRRGGHDVSLVQRW